MAVQKGRGVRVEIGKTEGAAKVVTAVTAANPGVASSAAHGLTDGTIGYFTGVAGMTPLEGQAISVDSPVTATFNLEEFDTSSWPAFTAGNFVPITAWSTLSTSTSYEIAGGEADQLDATTLLDDIKQSEPGMLAGQTVTFSSLSDAQLEAMKLIRAAAKKGAALVVRITFKNGERRVFRGVPGLPGESTQQGQLATGSIPFVVKGECLFLPA